MSGFSIEGRRLRLSGWRRWVTLSLLLGCMGFRAAPGQSATDAALRGRVTDDRGLALRSAQVRLRAIGADGGLRTSAGVMARTDGDGEFVLVGLDPGEYGVQVQAPGGKAWTGPLTLTLEPGEVREWDLRLSFERTGQILSSAEGGAQPGAGVVAFGIAGTAGGVLTELPFEDRQWEAVEEVSSQAHDATLAGGGSAQDASEEQDSAAARAEQQSGSPASGLSFDGMAATENAQTVDGLSADQFYGSGPRGAAQGGTRMGSSFAQSAVSTVRVMPRTFSAQYGGAAGGVVEVRTRRAEPELRGSVFLQDRQSAWAATNPFAVVNRYQDGVVSSVLAKPNESELQYGGAAGVPLRAGLLRRWHAGLFGSVEGQTQVQTLISSPETADFFALTPMQMALLANRGVGAAAVNAALNYLDSLTGSTVTYTPRTLGFARVDLAPARSDRLNVGVQVQRQNSPVAGGLVSSGVTDSAIGSIGTGHVQTEAYTAQWEHVLGMRAANSLRFQIAEEARTETPPVTPASEPGIGPGGYAPQVAIAPQGFTYGTPENLGRVASPDEDRVQAADSVALRLGHHVLTLGADWSRVHDRVLSATNLDGAFLYDSGTTNGRAGGLVDWITDYTFNVHAYPNGGCPSIYATVHDFCFRSYAQSFTGAPTEFVTHQFAGFAEDSVRVRRDVLLTLGMRYDYLLLPFPQQPNATLDSILSTLNSPIGGTTASFPEDRNNFGPRFSLTWSPRRGSGGRWMTVQAGYGMFYGRLPGAAIDAALADTDMPGSTTRIRILPTTETDCPQVANQGFGYPCAFLSAPAGVAAQTASTLVFSRRFRLPAVQRGTVALERELGRRVFVRAEYATAWATQLPQSVDLNVAPSTEMATYEIQGGDGHRGVQTGQMFSVPLYTSRLTSLYGPVTALVSNANATFNSGTMEVRVRDWRGLALRGSYTFSRAIDYGPQSSPAPRQDGQFDPFTDGYDKGLSSFQIPQRFAAYVVYGSRLRAGPRELRAALSGWRVATIATGSSGPPYSYVVFGGTRLSGGRESINGSGGATYLPTVGRNTLRLPARGRVDLRLGRELPMGRLRLELRADAFNVLNSVSVSRVETRAFLPGAPAVTGDPTPLMFQDAATIASEGLTTPAFGTALSSTSGGSRERQVEVGAKLNF